MLRPKSETIPSFALQVWRHRLHLVFEHVDPMAGSQQRATLQVLPLQVLPLQVLPLQVLPLQMLPPLQLLFHTPPRANSSQPLQILKNIMNEILTRAALDS